MPTNSTDEILRQALHACADARDKIVPGQGEGLKDFADELYGDEDKNPSVEGPESPITALLPCPFCGARPTTPFTTNAHHIYIRITHAEHCIFAVDQSRHQWLMDEAAFERWNTRAESPSPAQDRAETLTRYQRDVLKSAGANHIWLNAFACVRPTDEFKISLADQILAMLNDKDYLIYDHQDSESEAWRNLGKLMPELVVRINKS